MAFTYTPFVSDRDRVRFKLGDTDPAAPKFSDEEIDAIITEAGTWQAAVIECIDNLIARLSVPDFQADWLRVDSSKARAGLQDLRKQLARELGVNTLTVSVTHVYRADSRATEAPDYSDTTDDD